MKASKFTDAQKAFILQQGAMGILWRRSAARPGSARRRTSAAGGSYGLIGLLALERQRATAFQPAGPLVARPRGMEEARERHVQDLCQSV